MRHTGATPVETEEKEERGSGRSQNVVHTLPRSMASVPRFLTGPLERTDPTVGATQVLVITSDPESALALAETVLRITGPAGIELFPVTSARRASRLMAGRPLSAIAGAPTDIQELVRGSHLKLDEIRTVVLAWADEILNGPEGDVAALESIMGELPREAARVVVTSRSEGRVNAFAERYLRRARREVEDESPADAPQIALQYVTVSPTSRTASLRRLLDDLDPPSAAIVVRTPESEAELSRTLRLLGYSGGPATVELTQGETAEGTHAVIFYDVPETREILTAAAKSTPVVIVALVEPRELPALRRMAGGEVTPFTLRGPANTARDHEVGLRKELAKVLEAGVPSREVLALEPLLERHDGIEIAAAALRLLERERAQRVASEIAKAAAEPARRMPAAAPDRGAPGSRGARGKSSGFRVPGRDDRSPGGVKNRDSRPPRPAEGYRGGAGRPMRDDGGRPRDDRGRPPRDNSDRPRDAGGRGPRDDRGRPPREGFSRPPRRDRP
ncbi:MAG: DEAD/DEAH box helicase [Gemmatimonadaceae bacterium]|nr:DEAD/DEAH box helicase [Gemmatimonadaceae bacterium]MDQ3243301.1 DEAD/DEAH box helicase [Gemmatimonadota bacterium]